MRNVAVAEGDKVKVEAQLKFGWEVDTYPVNEIAEAVGAVSESDTNALVDEHTAFSYDLISEQMVDWAEAMGIESVVIDADTTIRNFKNELRWNAAAYR